MTDDTLQHHFHSDLGMMPDPSGSGTANVASCGISSNGSPASSINGDPNNHVKRKRSATDMIQPEWKESRPLLNSMELSTDLVEEIRKVIRQELVLGAYNAKDQEPRMATDNGTGGPDGDGSVDHSGDTAVDRAQEGRLLQPNVALQTRRGDQNDDGSCSSRTAPDGDPHRIATRTPTHTPISVHSPSTTGSVPPSPLTSQTSLKPGVRFSDNVTLVPSPVSGPVPARTAPWSSHRRVLGPGSEPLTEWGALFDENGIPTVRCEQVFRGLARYLAEEFPPDGEIVVTPEKLGLLFLRFGIKGEVYPFKDIFHTMPRQLNTTDNAAVSSSSNDNNNTSQVLTVYHNLISDFFSDLSCEYYLVPPVKTVPLISTSSPSATTATSKPNIHAPLLHPGPRLRSARPCIPALTLAGFARFYTLCVLAHPDKEAKRLDNIASELALSADVIKPPGSRSNNSSSTAGNADAGGCALGNTSSSERLINPFTTSSPTLRLAIPRSQTWNSPSLSPPLSASVSVSPITAPTASTSSESPGGGGGGDKLPRQFVRSLLPVNPDNNARRGLSNAVQDLQEDLKRCCGFGLSTSTSTATVTTIDTARPPRPLAPPEHSRRWSTANIPTLSSCAGGVSRSHQQQQQQQRPYASAVVIKSAHGVVDDDDDGGNNNHKNKNNHEDNYPSSSSSPSSTSSDADVALSTTTATTTAAHAPRPRSRSRHRPRPVITIDRRSSYHGHEREHSYWRERAARERDNRDRDRSRGRYNREREREREQATKDRDRDHWSRWLWSSSGRKERNNNIRDKSRDRDREHGNRNERDRETNHNNNNGSSGMSRRPPSTQRRFSDRRQQQTSSSGLVLPEISTASSAMPPPPLPLPSPGGRGGGHLALVPVAIATATATPQQQRLGRGVSFLN